jgi:hypothetical protein
LEYDFLTEIVFETDCFDNMTAKKNTPVKKLCPKLAQLDKMEFEEPMFSAPVPYLGFKFLKFIEAGVIIHGIIHKELQMFGRFSFNTGIRWKMPPNSRFFLDLNARSASKMEMKGLTKPDFFLEPKEGNMEAQILFFAGPRFDIGLSLFDKLELELQTQFRTPAATLNFSAGYRELPQHPFPLQTRSLAAGPLTQIFSYRARGLLHREQKGQNRHQSSLAVQYSGLGQNSQSGLGRAVDCCVDFHWRSQSSQHNPGLE